MNIVLIALGSSGDVNPFVWLGLGLKARGHRVTLVTNGHFAPLVRRAGLEYEELGTEEDYRTVTEMAELWQPVKGFRKVVEWAMLKPMRLVYEIVERLNVPGETVVAGPPTAFGARVAREKLGVPLVTVNLQPVVFRSLEQAPVMHPLPVSNRMPRAWNRFWYWFADVRAIDPLVRPEVNAFRAELGLPPVRRLFNGWWFSPDRVLALFPDWFAPAQTDWPAQTRQTGFPLHDESDATPLAPEVEAFLSAGDPPLVFTPGSAMRHGHDFFQAAIDASQRLGRRAALVTPFREQVPGERPEGVRHFSFIPFSRIFPRAAAVIHHGGVGTAAQGLAAGVPQLVMPLAHDQFDNAERLRILGVGRSLVRSKFRAPAVAQALGELIKRPAVAARTRACAERVRQADPLADSCRVIEQVLEVRVKPMVPS